MYCKMLAHLHSRKLRLLLITVLKPYIRVLKCLKVVMKTRRYIYFCFVNCTYAINYWCFLWYVPDFFGLGDVDRKMVDNDKVVARARPSFRC